MPDWNEIFSTHGYFFKEPHEDLPRLVKLFQREGMSRILDLGCGSGRHLIHLAHHGFDAYGLDSSPHALALAEEWLDKEGVSANIHQQRMEESFPYLDHFFDAVISIQVIHHNCINDILFTVKEIERITHSGSYVFITVPVLGPKPPIPEDDWNLRQIEEGTYVPESGPESGIPHHYFTEDELLQIFYKFEKIELYMDSSNHRCFLGRKRF